MALLIPKEVNLESQQYRRWIAGHDPIVPVLIGEFSEENHPHHLMRAQFGRMGDKVGDQWCVPLTFIQHAKLHAHGNEIAWFEERKKKYEDVLDWCRGKVQEAIRLKIIKPMEKW